MLAPDPVMIISASRRTDIPAFYGRWFLNRLRAGFCLVPNPFNPRQVRRVSLRAEDVAAFVFWTRSPTPFQPVLDELDRRGCQYLFLFTLTGYGPPLEPAAPAAAEAVAAFRLLARRIGADRVVWRYDPIVLGPGLMIDDHVARFRQLAMDLAGATVLVKISFVDLYRKALRRLRQLPQGQHYTTDPVLDPGASHLIGSLAGIAAEAGMRVETCAEDHDYSDLGAPPGGCIDGHLLSRLLGRSFPTAKDSGQRPACRCTRSIDIGMNDSCVHGCVYCYATRSHELALGNRAGYGPQSPSLLPLSSPDGG